MNKTPLQSIAIALLFSMLAACQSSGSPASGTAPIPVANTVAVTAPARKYLSLGSVSMAQSGKAPDYTIKVETPVMNGSQDPHVVAFNRAVSAAVQQQIEAFKKSLDEAPAIPIVGGSSFDLKSTLVGQSEHVVSLQLNMSQYIDGAAHPFSYTVAFNYDLARDREISLDQLFTPGASYLLAISDYCKTELGKRAIGFDTQQTGADPTVENYRNWNIGADGLVITFDPYQVAAYAAGPQVVTIPYAVLKDIIDPQGPLAEFER